MRIIYSKYALPAAACAAIASAMSVATPAQAFEFKVSGQVDRAIDAVDNGEQKDIGFVDNAGSNTRFRFTGDQKMDNGMTVGFAYEIGLGNGSSSAFDVDNGQNNNSTFLDNRLANVYLQGAFGKFTLGKVDGAANGSSELDYSGLTYLGGGSDIVDYASSLSFLDDNGNTITNLGGAMDQFDALSRQNAVRYDTPSFGGFVLSASLDNGHAFEVAPRFETEFGDGGKFGFVADYVDSQSQGRDIQPNGVVVNEGNRFKEYGGSTSLLLPFGLNFTGSYKHRNFLHAGNGNADNYFGGIGYIVGNNHVQVGYDQTDDLLNEGSKARGYNLSYLYNWTSSINLYASYHVYTLDNADDPNGGGRVDAQHIDQIYTGVRLKFL